MKFLILIVTVVAAFSSGGAEPVRSLEKWASEYRRSRHLPPPIALTAHLKTQKGAHSLSFRLTNISNAPLTVATGFLPWADPSQLTIAAFTTEGKHLDNAYYGEPRGPRIRLAPGKWLEGDYPLTWGLGAEPPADKDTIIVWLYAFPIDGPYEDWPTCTGALLVPKSK